jgi:hypothetical protein
VKCIYCKVDSKLKDRAGKLCSGCKRSFAFEPRSGDPFTDMAFMSAIDEVSSKGTVRFLPEHVYYALARRKRSKGTGRVVLFTLGAMSLIMLPFAPVAGAVTAGIMGSMGLLAGPSTVTKLSRETFADLWRRWLEVHGTPAKLIVRALREGPFRAAPVIPAEMEHYSFDRAVICDRAETVDVLLANNFHFENNCAVLAESGYPQAVFATVRRMLKGNPRLVVYVLHDADVRGCLLAHRLVTDPDWFHQGPKVVEVGIRPAHAMKLKGVWSIAGEAEATPHLTRAEHKWLSRYSLELAAIRPEQVIKRLFAAIASEAKLEKSSTYVGDSGGGSDYWVNSSSFSTDASASDGGDDSFG